MPIFLNISEGKVMHLGLEGKIKKEKGGSIYRGKHR
jgi:hypothetical protein